LLDARLLDSVPFSMPLKTLSEYETLAEQAHGHLCAGQILGLRMALCGMRLLELDDPAGRDRKRLVTFVEIDEAELFSHEPSVVFVDEHNSQVDAA